MRQLRCVLVIVLLTLVLPPSGFMPSAHADELPPIKVFVLAGQSNMAGQAVVDLVGSDYNEGRGTLVALASDPRTAALVAPFRNTDGSWRLRDDVFVRYSPDDGHTTMGPLGFGFTPYLDQHHFGPELAFGRVLGDELENPVLLVKTAWGGKSLFKEFRPPSSGGEVGPCYQRMIEQVRTAVARATEEIPAAKARRVELAGFVWYHGWNDGCDPEHAVPEYETNLVHLIRDVRRDLGAPGLPVVVGEITGPWVEAPDEWGMLRKAQAAATRHPEFAGNVAFVSTAAFVREAKDSPHPDHAHHEFGNAETYLLVGDALGRAMLTMIASEAAPDRARPRPVDPLPSWNEGTTRSALLAFVERVTKQDSPDFVPPSERIAVFDNDGTLWAEQPMYVQMYFVLDRVKALAPQHPEWKTKEPFASVLRGDLDSALAGGEHALMELVMATHTGMTTDEFTRRVKEWISTARHPQTGRLFTAMVYQPMLELLSFLRANGFKIFIVSGGGIEFMRPWAEEVYGIPPEQVIGSSVKTTFELREGGPVLARLPELNFIDDGKGKPVGIHEHIGRRPIAAFGNSDGDLQMLQWTAAGGGARYCLFVHHDDAAREWAYDRESKIGRLDKGLDEAIASGWTIASMKRDWKSIHPTEASSSRPTARTAPSARDQRIASPPR